MAETAGNLDQKSDYQMVEEYIKCLFLAAISENDCE